MAQSPLFHLTLMLSVMKIMNVFCSLNLTKRNLSTSYVSKSVGIFIIILNKNTRSGKGLRTPICMQQPSCYVGWSPLRLIVTPLSVCFRTRTRCRTDYVTWKLKQRPIVNTVLMKTALFSMSCGTAPDLLNWEENGHLSSLTALLGPLVPKMPWFVLPTCQLQSEISGTNFSC